MVGSSFYIRNDGAGKDSTLGKKDAFERIW